MIKLTPETLRNAHRAIMGDACSECGGTDWVCAEDVDAHIPAWAAEREECAREHPPEPAYTEWVRAGKPDMAADRKRIEMLTDALECRVPALEARIEVLERERDETRAEVRLQTEHSLTSWVLDAVLRLGWTPPAALRSEEER